MKYIQIITASLLCGYAADHTLVCAMDSSSSSQERAGHIQLAPAEERNFRTVLAGGSLAAVGFLVYYTADDQFVRNSAAGIGAVGVCAGVYGLARLCRIANTAS